MQQIFNHYFQNSSLPYALDNIKNTLKYTLSQISSHKIILIFSMIIACTAAFLRLKKINFFAKPLVKKDKLTTIKKIFEDEI